jgi:hypothetical protein
MGSSVIVLTENRVVDVYNLDQCCSVLYGQPLADILRSLSSRDD